MRVWGGVEQSVTARFGPGRRTTDYAQRVFARPFPAAAIPLRQRRSTPIAPILRNHSARAAVPRHFTWYLDLGSSALAAQRQVGIARTLHLRILK